MFDLLGSKAAMEGPSSESFLQRMWTALAEAREWMQDSKHPEWDPYAIKWHTDNLVLGWPFHYYHQDDTEPPLGFTFLQTANFQATLSLHGLFGRGAITVGDHYMDDYFVFGPALIEAYRLEADAKVPRVLLSEGAFGLAVEHTRSYGDLQDAPQNDEILVADDGTPFISYLCPLLDWVPNPLEILHRHADVVGEKLVKAPREKIKRKFRWVAHYHNYFCETYFPQGDRVPVGRSRPPSFYRLEDIFRRAGVPLRYPIERI